jgi:hypothetical protein
MATNTLDLEGRLRQKIGRASRTESVAIRFTEAEANELEASAKQAATTLREWGRDALLKAARESRADALFTELIATRMLLVNLLKPMLLGKPMPDNWIEEATSGVHAAKHKAAARLRKEYVVRERKEVSNGDTLG